MTHWQQEMFWRFLVLGLLVALLDGVAASSTNCTEGCRICADECLMCEKGYYRSYGECEECKPNCRRCFRDGMCYFDCTDGWYGLDCSRPCSCSYGICDKYSGTCPYKPDPPVLVSGNDEDAEDVAEDDGLTGKIFIIIACILPIFVTCVCCMRKKRKQNEEQMALDNTDIVPPSQKLLPGQVPITMRSTNTTHANSFAGNFTSYISGDFDGNNIMCPPRETNIAPPPLATYSGQQTDVALTHCTTNSRQDTDIATAPCATYGGQQTNVGPLPSATYCEQQTDIGSSLSASYSGQQTDIAPPPPYTPSGQQANILPPPSYESLFNSNREHTQ
ncbi:uncharacterized protein LOC124139731 [Haliotis rufescens]|uniref:uncharacterized protein LOC124139731 n=1 Tax=Haliotis rufescens TaxID=6454 RepID=UPI00201E945D|nr:uncharacterized protein LOC124139731 [Haliotis rufescens]